MPVWGHRGVTEGTPRSPFCSLYTAMPKRGYRAWERRTLVRHVLALKPYRAVAKKRGAYAAMPLRGYRGVTSGLTSKAHEVSRSLPWTAWERLGTLDFSPACLFFFRENAVPSRFFLRVFCALCANPVFQNKHKSVSRRREKKGCLRRDARVGYRGVTSGLTSEAHEVSRYAPRAFFFVTRLLGSRHRLAFRTRAVVLHDDNQGDKRKTDQVGRQPRIDQ